MQGLKQAAAVAAALWAAIAFAPAVQAQGDYPNKPIRIVVGFIPGSSADITARVLGNKLGQILGQSIVVENKAGAGSSLAAEQVARSPSDGYTLFVASSANITNEAISPNIPVKIAKDFTPIALINNAAVILVVHPSLGVNSLKELIELAKKKQDELSYASTGVGTAPHLSGELFNMRNGTKLLHVPYQGSPQAATDLIAGRVGIMFSPASAVVSQVQAGTLKVLASATAKRPGILPDVPTMAEQGFPGYQVFAWCGLAAPAGTPDAVIARWNAMVNEAMADPGVARKIANQDYEPRGGTTAAYVEYFSKDIEQYRRLVEATIGVARRLRSVAH